jgi:hypothetical protein
MRTLGSVVACHCVCLWGRGWVCRSCGRRAVTVVEAVMSAGAELRGLAFGPWCEGAVASTPERTHGCSSDLVGDRMHSRHQAIVSNADADAVVDRSRLTAVSVRDLAGLCDLSHAVPLSPTHSSHTLASLIKWSISMRRCGTALHNGGPRYNWSLRTGGGLAPMYRSRPFNNQWRRA